MLNTEKKWHLSKRSKDAEVTDFEVNLWQVFYAFLRWQENCEKSANGNELSGNDLSVLHVIRILERPKSVQDIAQFLNRDDSFNIRYSIKKLRQMGLIEKAKASTWQITEAGIINTDAMAKARSTFLVDLFSRETGINLPDITKGLARIKHIYQQAAIAVAYSYKEQPEDSNES